MPNKIEIYKGVTQHNMTFTVYDGDIDSPEYQSFLGYHIYENRHGVSHTDETSEVRYILENYLAQGVTEYKLNITHSHWHVSTTRYGIEGFIQDFLDSTAEFNHA